jgi:exopolysaccharide/PEP-CTERM locus tyrosine autokinase
MSKIEKALQRARTERGLALVPTSRPLPKTEAPSVPEHRDGGTEIAARVRSSESIALMREPQARHKNELLLNRIIHAEMVDNPTVQAFRELRTKILQKSGGRNCVIMVTSAVGNGGSSFVSLNLSAAFAFDAGKTALLMDCNLRSPWCHNLFQEKSVLGLTDYLESSSLDVGKVIHPVGIERLRVIPAGGKREIPAEYFTSEKMKSLLGGIRKRYPERFVILDAPPMTESADTQILAELCDYIVLVVPYGTVTLSQIEECTKALDGKKLLGVIFNNEPELPKLRWWGVVVWPLTAVMHWFRDRLKMKRSNAA